MRERRECGPASQTGSAKEGVKSKELSGEEHFQTGGNCSSRYRLAWIGPGGGAEFRDAGPRCFVVERACGLEV
jgi:hypothetical protein